MGDELYIWISRWEDFQHYKPERDRGPAWIKDYTKQMLDDRYLRLTDRQRALLRDLRDVFAMTLGRLPDDARTITRHRQSQTRHADLEALNHAGLIEVISRETLERRLERLYSSPRARVEVDLEVDTPLPPADAGGESFTRGKSKTRRPSRDDEILTCPKCRLPFTARTILDEHLYHSHDGPEPAHWRSPPSDPEPTQSSLDDVELPSPDERRRIAAELRASLLGAVANGASAHEQATPVDDDWVAEAPEAGA